MTGLDGYLASLEARIAALEEIALEAESLRDEARQTECLHSPEIRADGMLFCGCGMELGPVDLDQVQQLAASPYLPWEIEGKNP